MNENKMISWIFLATAVSSQNAPSNIKSIVMTADGINKAIPTDKELQSSFAWLIDEGLIAHETNNYYLTEKGIFNYKAALLNTKNIFDIWENVTNLLWK